MVQDDLQLDFNAAPGDEIIADILIVDDRAENLLTLEAALEPLHQNLVRASSGTEALRLLLQHDFAVILLDVQMPGMDGFETATLMREREKSKHIPIIFLTAISKDERYIFKGYSAGAVDYLFKPFDPQILRAKVAVFVELYKRTEAMRQQVQFLHESGQRDQKDKERQLTELQLNIEHRLLAELTVLNAQLEQRVAERTAQLEQANTELEAANKELEAFSYSVSHDLRAPLRAIDGFTRIVLKDYGTQLPEEGCGQLQMVRDNAQQMNQLIDDLLAFSRFNRQTIKRGPVDMAGLARQALDNLHSVEPGRQLEIAIDELPVAQGDAALLKQVFINLLSNALKYSRKRETTVIEVGSLTDAKMPNEHIYFVKDNGVGFDMKYAPKLFGVFQRLHRANEYEGTGVGLAIVQRIVNRHGGQIWAEAELDKGATFFFSLPANQ